MRIGVCAFVTDRGAPPAELARRAEALGFASFWLPEHTHLPVAESEPPALVAGVQAEDYARSVDPLVALAGAAAVTERITLGVGVLLVAEHDAIVLAKQIATLDLVSGGRFMLGVGYGWNRQEMADHGVAFAERRAVAHETLAAMRALWRDDPAEFQGRHVAFGPCHAWPKPAAGAVPVVFGGGAGPKLFAAIAEHGDGWLPIGGSGLATALPALRQAMADAGRAPESVWVAPFGVTPDPGKLAYYRDLGVAEVVLRLPSGPPDVMLAGLDELARFL